MSESPLCWLNKTANELIINPPTISIIKTNTLILILILILLILIFLYTSDSVLPIRFSLSSLDLQHKFQQILIFESNVGLLFYHISKLCYDMLTYLIWDLYTALYKKNSGILHAVIIARTLLYEQTTIFSHFEGSI